MKIYPVLLFTLFLTLFSACNGGQVKTNLTAPEFQEKISKTENAVLLDVRTPGEFTEGHLENAKNINWNDAAFEANISTLDKDAPVFVYCLSGARSASAAAKMRSIGFKEVYELSGGIMAWRANSLPEAGAATSAAAGMDKMQYSKLLENNKLVLVDFYAEWCGPCKKMEPHLDAIKKELADKVEVIRIDADANKTLVKEMNIQGLPMLYLYKAGQQVWESNKYTSKEEMVRAIETNL
jgi:thioredoxin 1